MIHEDSDVGSLGVGHSRFASGKNVHFTQIIENDVHRNGGVLTVETVDNENYEQKRA